MCSYDLKIMVDNIINLLPLCVNCKNCIIEYNKYYLKPTYTKYYNLLVISNLK